MHSCFENRVVTLCVLCQDYTIIYVSNFNILQGILPTMDELLEGVDQRFCVRHLYNNVRKRFPGKKLKELMWKASKATYDNAFKDAMK